MKTTDRERGRLCGIFWFELNMVSSGAELLAKNEGGVLAKFKKRLGASFGQ